MVVLDLTLDLVASEPHADSDGVARSFIVILFYFLDFDSQVGEVLLNFASLTLHSNLSCVDGNSHYKHALLQSSHGLTIIRDLHKVFGQKSPHFADIFFIK